MLCLVLALSMVGCGTEKIRNADNEENRDLIPMVMIDGKLYLHTGANNTELRKCDTFDGEITSSVSGSERPTENNQSNFGTGFGYQYGKIDGTVEILMDDKWCIFAVEEIQQQMGHPYSSVEDKSVAQDGFTKQ